MAFIEAQHRRQAVLFSALDDLIPEDHACRILDAFVRSLDLEKLGFLRAAPAETGRPGYDPRDLLRLLLYGYSQQIRSSRRLEAECRRNVELMWLLGRLEPDHKTIAEFRRQHSEPLRRAEAALVEFARKQGMVTGEWVAIDGTKFRAQSSYESVRQRTEWESYLAEADDADQQEEAQRKRAEVERKLIEHPEPEARFMRCAGGTNKIPGYNLQIAVDAEHALIVAAEASTEANDARSLQPMAEVALARVGRPGRELHVVADTGYSNGEQAQACEERGIVPHVPRKYGTNNTPGPTRRFDSTEFRYDQQTDTYLCPAQQRLVRRQLSNESRAIVYAGRAEVCGQCPLKTQCTSSPRRTLKRHLYADALERMQQRATAELMRLRRSIVEHPFASLKYRVFGHPKLLLRGRRGAQTEFSLAAMVYNLKRMTNVLGGTRLRQCLEAG
jgi:transposase